jgi:hypothetical protein
MLAGGFVIAIARRVRQTRDAKSIMTYEHSNEGYADVCRHGHAHQQPGKLQFLVACR